MSGVEVLRDCVIQLYTGHMYVCFSGRPEMTAAIYIRLY